MGQVIKMKLDEVDNPNVIGEYWRRITFVQNTFELTKEFTTYFTSDWLDGEAPTVLYDYFDYLNDEQYSEEECPEFAFNQKLNLWVAWHENTLLFYDEKEDICVYNTNYINRETWEYF